MITALLFLTGVLFHCKIAYSDIRPPYPNRILVDEVTVDDIKNVWKCQDGSSTNPFGTVTIGDLLEAYPTDWFFLGATPMDSNLIKVGAFIPASIIPLKEAFVSESIYWYNNDIAFGFAPNNEINLRWSDVTYEQFEKRYSITHKVPETSDEVGSRAALWLTAGGKDVIYRCSLPVCDSPTCRPTSSPTTCPPTKPSRKRCKPTKKPISRCAPHKNTKGGKNLSEGDETVDTTQGDLNSEASMEERL
jgi:hypothetical protein